MYYYSTSFNGNAIFQSVGFFIGDGSFKHSSRIIESYELIFGVSGILPIEVNGTRYDLQPNEILIIPPNIPHSGYKKAENDVQFIWIHMTLDNLKICEKRDFLELYKINENNSRFLILPIYYDKMDMNRLFLMSNQLMDIYQEKVSQTYLNTYLNCILQEISYQALVLAKQKQIINNDMQPIQDWLRIHAFENISLQGIADYFNYNKNYLSRKYKEIVGIGITDQIMKYRVNRAKLLLSDTSQTIQEISYKIGYEDPKYFMRIFKCLERITPSEYRKAFNQKHFNNE